jgi:transposase
MKKASVIQLSPAEHRTLCKIERAASTTQAMSIRVKIILLATKGMCNKDIAKELKISEHTVGRWRYRFILDRVEGLSDAPRSGRPPVYDEKVTGEIIAKTLTPPPEGITHWSTREMAGETGISRSTIHRIWRKNRLQPHRVESFKYSNDPNLKEKVIDVVGLYLNPPDNALVLSVDEKSQIQALDRTQPLLPLRPGQVERHTHDYVRHGTTTLFAALDVAQGTVIGECYPRHRHKEFLRFLSLLNRQVSKGKEIHLILDNYSTHKHEKVNRWLNRHRRFKLHFTPTSASWLNQIEIWFGILNVKQIRRGVFRSVDDLIEKIKVFIKRHNENAKPFVWTKNPEYILSMATTKNNIKD